MNYPDFKTYREDRWQPRMTPLSRRPHFLGQSILGLQWHSEKPAVNIKQEDALFEIEIAMPGFLKEEIQVTVFDDILTVRGEKEKKENPKSQYILQEFDTDVLERQFKLAKGIGHDKIMADFANGILKIAFSEVKNSEEEPVRKVEISN